MTRIEAKKLSRELDRNIRDWTPESLHRTYLTHGCAVVRGAIDATRRAQVKEAIGQAYAEKPGALHVYNRDIEASSGGNVSGWELVDVPLLQDFLSLTFRGQGWGREHVTARRISGIDSDTFWQDPLDLHLDAQFHHFQFVVNFWVPFDRCGEDAPSLQLVPLNYRKTRAWSQFIGHQHRQDEPFFFGYFRKDLPNPDTSIASFGEDCFFRPIMNPGDVIVSSNWVLHGSYRTPQMKRGRSSAELRFVGSNLDLDETIPWPTKQPAIVSRLRAIFQLADDRR